jgi:hypothetical protein
MIYTRQMFLDQWKFLTDEVIGNSVFGWIIGPPGAGKSISAYSFLLNLNNQMNPEWIITWIHLSNDFLPLVEQFHGNYKYTDIIGSREELEDMLYSVSEKKHIVMIDGYTDIQEHRDIMMPCQRWLAQNVDLSRLVVLCSMTSRGKTNYDDDTIHHVKEFFCEFLEK